MLKYFSLFAGIGGFDRAIENALGKCSVQCVGFSEIDKYAKAIYRDHFEEVKDYGNARRIIPLQIPEFQLLVAGFPCQAFSIAGKRKGFSDVRGTLFFEIARILSDRRPRYFILENVSGILCHEDGKTFQTILRVLADLGYDIQWQILNSKDFGIAQNRPRTFIIGILRGTGRQQILPIEPTDFYLGKTQDQKRRGGTRLRNDNPPIANCIRARYYKDRQENLIGTLRTHNCDKGFRPVKSNLCPAIPARAREDGSGQPVVMLTDTRSDEAKEIRKESMKNGRDYSPRRGKEFKARDDDLANCITASTSKEHLLMIEYSKIRRLTPVECERLQGFPDNWTAEGLFSHGKKPISDTQRYKCLGNAITVNVVREIIKKMFL